MHEIAKIMTSVALISFCLSIQNSEQLVNEQKHNHLTARPYTYTYMYIYLYIIEPK